MKTLCSPNRWTLALALAATVALALSRAEASKIILRDGRIVEGRVGLVMSMAEQVSRTAPSEGVKSPMITLVDDNLRRTFVPKLQVAEVSEVGPAEPEEQFVLKQPVARGGGQVAMVGPLVEIGTFDEFGRRILKMSTTDGVVSVVQGITTLTPTWAKVETLTVEGRSFVWDMRLATSSIPPDVLDRILLKQVDPTKVEQRLKLVRFYIQAERYQDAEAKLKQLIEEFPDRREQYETVLVRLRQSLARRILAEAELRRAAGQHRLTQSMLEHFPTENVAGETLQSVRQMLADNRTAFERGSAIVERLQADIALVGDEDLRKRLELIGREIAEEINFNTINRLGPYWQLHDDPGLSVEERTALAVSGWFVGPDDVARNLRVAVSLFDVRRLVRDYLNEPNKIRREQLLAELRTLEGGNTANVAKLIAHMKPQQQPGKSVDGEPGLYRLSVETLPGLAPVTYLVQIPPEYDPLRSYPTIVTLHGTGIPALQQLEWWTGARNEQGTRQGQATRRGYIVVAPEWGEEHQQRYGYTLREHAAVVNALRDASRKFSIDPDRVFLSGHSMGGDAAWDLALAHPDLWAGVIPVTASADKYVAHYFKNGKSLPMYFVGGEYDGNRALYNARDLDRYMRHGYNVTVVEYLGRGHEHFADEVLRLFDWMGRHRREFFPRELSVNTMRAWDNYFWWVELDGLPEKVIVDPLSWPAPRGAVPLLVEGQITQTGTINVRTGATRTTLWLSPEMIDFEQPAQITVNGKQLRVPNRFIEPALGVLLEDVRLRADRRHPFWAKVEMPLGVVNAGE